MLAKYLKQTLWRFVVVVVDRLGFLGGRRTSIRWDEETTCVSRRGSGGGGRNN